MDSTQIPTLWIPLKSQPCGFHSNLNLVVSAINSQTNGPTPLIGLDWSFRQCMSKVSRLVMCNISPRRKCMLDNTRQTAITRYFRKKGINQPLKLNITAKLCHMLIMKGGRGGQIKCWNPYRQWTSITLFVYRSPNCRKHYIQQDSNSSQSRR